MAQAKRKKITRSLVEKLRSNSHIVSQYHAKKHFSIRKEKRYLYNGETGGHHLNQIIKFCNDGINQRKMLPTYQIYIDVLQNRSKLLKTIGIFEDKKGVEAGCSGSCL